MASSRHGKGGVDPAELKDGEFVRLREKDAGSLFVLRRDMDAEMLEEAVLYGICGYSFLSGVCGCKVFSPKASGCTDPPGCAVRIVTFLGNPGAYAAHVELWNRRERRRDPSPDRTPDDSESRYVWWMECTKGSAAGRRVLYRNDLLTFTVLSSLANRKTKDDTGTHARQHLDLFLSNRRPSGGTGCSLWNANPTPLQVLLHAVFVDRKRWNRDDDKGCFRKTVTLCDRQRVLRYRPGERLDVDGASFFYPVRCAVHSFIAAHARNTRPKKPSPYRGQKTR